MLSVAYELSHVGCSLYLCGVHSYKSFKMCFVMLQYESLGSALLDNDAIMNMRKHVFNTSMHTHTAYIRGCRARRITLCRHRPYLGNNKKTQKTIGPSFLPPVCV